MAHFPGPPPPFGELWELFGIWQAQEAARHQLRDALDDLDEAIGRLERFRALIGPRARPQELDSLSETVAALRGARPAVLTALRTLEDIRERGIMP